MASISGSAGGLFSGAEVHKTPEQVAIYRGLAGMAYDLCYHQACDTFVGSGDGPGATPPGLGLVSLDQLSDGVARAVLSFATTTSAVPGTDKSSDKATSRKIGTSQRPRQGATFDVVQTTATEPSRR